MLCKRAVLALIDCLLPVFNAHTHGKGFWRHWNFGVMQHLYRISGAVANGQDYVRAGESLLLAVRLVTDAGKLAVLQL